MFVSDPLPNFHSISSSYGRPSLCQNNTLTQSCDSTDLKQNSSNLVNSSQADAPNGTPQLQDIDRFHDETPFLFQSGQPDPARDDQENPFILGFYGIIQNHPTSFTSTNRSVSLSHSNQATENGRSSSNPRHELVHINEYECGEDTGNQPRRKSQALGFGSDAGFRSQRYAPPPSLEDSQIIEGRVLRVLEGLEEAPTSATNTQTSSPVISRSKRHCSDPNSDLPNRRADPSTNSTNPRGIRQSAGEKRRRRVKEHDHKRHVTDFSRDRLESQPSKKAKPDVKIRSSSNESHSDLRRSYLNDHKPPRQNLTEEEKKQNHIKSEQKRRNQIKEGFDALIELIPDGMSAATSKCAILAKAAEWLSDLIDGNKQLREQLVALDKNTV